MAGTSFVACSVAFGVALAMPSLAAAAPAYIVAAGLLEAPNPPLDAGRLDVVPAALWGRAESVRTVFRNVAYAAGPLLFGVVVDGFGGLAGRASALSLTFAVMLVPLLASGAVVLAARRTYARDRAAASSAAPSASRRRPAGRAASAPATTATRGPRRPRA